MSVRIVFLDRDGTINNDCGYVKSWDQWQFANGAIDALLALQSAGFRLAIVTNQSGIAREFFTIADANVIHEILRTELLERGVVLDAVAMCPHAPDEQCACRKPKTGLVDDVQQQIGETIDFRRSWTVGDKLSDIEFGRRAGTATALLRSKYWRSNHLSIQPDLIASNVLDAAQQIITRCYGLRATNQDQR